MYPRLLEIGPVTLYTFGAMLGLAFLVAGHLTGREMTRRGLDGELASKLLLMAALGGIGGSRLWSIFNDWQNFSHAPLSGLLSGAGFVWYGGLVGGTVAVSAVIVRNGLPWLRTVDCIAPGLVLAQAIGRIGCHLAGDGDWGKVTDLPWGVAYTDAIIGWDYPPGVRVHPAPLYECAAYTAIFALLWSLRRRPAPDGAIFWLYLILAPAARLAIEFVRINPIVLLGLTQAQITSLALISVGAIMLAVTYARHPAAQTA
jgi:phosphatidylglycerol:prolipoprotein diacylglycerol transferase